MNPMRIATLPIPRRLAPTSRFVPRDTSVLEFRGKPTRAAVRKLREAFCMQKAGATLKVAGIMLVDTRANEYRQA